MPYPSLVHPERLPCGSPLLTRTSTGDIQTQFWLSLCGVSGSWCTQGFVCALQESVSPVLCKFWQLYGGLNGGLPQEGLCHTQICCTQSLSLQQATADLYLHRRYSNSSGSVSVGHSSPEVIKHFILYWGMNN